MATIVSSARTRAAGNALILLLGAAVFLTYVDRGAIAIAAPLMKTDLKMSATAFGLAVSAFFWVYAPVQLILGWLCDRFSVYRLIALGVALWAASTFLTSFVGGFMSLLVLRVLLGVGESIAFPGSSKIIAHHVPAEGRGRANAVVAMGIALGPAMGTLAGGVILASAGWRAVFMAFGLVTFLWLVPWRQTVRGLSDPIRSEPDRRVPIGRLTRHWSLWSMGLVHMAGNYGFYFMLTWLPLFLVQARGYSIGNMTMVATLGFAVQAMAAFGWGFISDSWTRSGREERIIRRWMMVGTQLIAAASVLGLIFARNLGEVAILLVLFGIASASLSLNLFAVGQMFAGPRAAGTWIGVQNSIGNISGIVGPIVTGVIVDRAGYDWAFYVAAGVAAVGAAWWAVGVPKIEQVKLD